MRVCTPILCPLGLRCGAARAPPLCEASLLSFAPQSVALDGLEDGRGTASLPSRSIHATSSDDWQLRPVRRIAGIQHWFGPPGRAEQPCPPHKTQSPWQQTRLEGCRTPAWQPNAAGVRDETPSACTSGGICVAPLRITTPRSTCGTRRYPGMFASRPRGT